MLQFLTVDFFRDHGPTYIMRIFKYWTPNQCPVHIEEAYFFASGIVVCSLINVAVIHPCMMTVLEIGMKMRIACCSLIYRKTLRLNLSTLEGPTIGNVVNLMSNDVNRFDMGVFYVHYIWLAPLQLLLCLLIMYKDVEIAAVSGISVILFFIPIQGLHPNFLPNLENFFFSLVW